MWKGFLQLLRKDMKMMLSGRFFLLAFLSLVLYSCYINFVYVNIEQENYHVYLYDPQNSFSGESEYLTEVNDRKEMEEACADRTSIGIDTSADIPEIYMLSSGIETTDHYRAIWAEAVLNGIKEEEAEIIGMYNKEEKSRREITTEFLFFELSAVGFLGLASVLFKEKQMGVIRVHGILPVSKFAFILSKICVFLLSDLLFTVLLTLINVGVFEGFILLPGILVQAGVLSLIMTLTGFLCAVWLSDFKQFSLFYLVFAVFATTPVFLVGQMGVSWDFIIYHPMYHLFTAMKSAYFNKTSVSFPYYFTCIGAIGILFYMVWRALIREVAKEG